MRIWTPEAKKAQAEAIRRWQPWNNSTGPQTEAGKSRTRLNAQKHGNYNAETRARHRECKALLIRQREFLKSIRLMLKCRKTLKTEEQTIISDVLLAQGQAISTALDNWCNNGQTRNSPAEVVQFTHKLPPRVPLCALPDRPGMIVFSELN